MNRKSLIIRIFVIFAYLSMVFVNFLANYLPINNIGSGEVSDMYPNLFAPAGITFSIWGLIYLLLGAYAIYQIGLYRKNKDKDQILDKVGVYFIISSLANILWVFSWHYRLIAFSLLLIIVILVCLIQITNIFGKQKMKGRDYLFIALPFSIYFGWITVATIANVVVFLVSVGWGGFGISEQIWTILILLVGSLICILRLFRDKSLAYGFVFIWAYFGILIKHTSENEFGGQYGGVIITLVISIFLILSSIVVLTFKKIKNK